MHGPKEIHWLRPLCLLQKTVSVVCCCYCSSSFAKVIKQLIMLMSMNILQLVPLMQGKREKLHLLTEILQETQEKSLEMAITEMSTAEKTDLMAEKKEEIT